MPTKAQSANKARLKRMHAGAKAYMRKHPNAKYASALKAAGAKERGKSSRKKVGGVKKKKGHPKKKSRVGATASVKTKLKAAHKREGLLLSKLGAATDSQIQSALKKRTEERLAWALFNKRNATTGP